MLYIWHAQIVNVTYCDVVILRWILMLLCVSVRDVLLLVFQVKLESNFASMVFAIMVLEGLGRSLDPNLDILEIAKPLLLRNLL